VIEKLKYSFIPILLFFVLACANDSTEKKNQVRKYVNTHGLPSLPKSMIFFGEQIQLEDEDIRERLDREIITNVYFQSSTTFALKRANRFFPEIERILANEDVPKDFKYVAVIESNLSEVTSPVGANGFWQFMPFTAKEYGLIINDEVDERLNLSKSTHAACAFIKNANAIFGDWVNACASYNRGIGGVQSDMKWQKTNHYFDTDMNNETGRYVFRIMAMKLIMENPEKYGFYIPAQQLYKPFSTKEIQCKSAISNLAHWAKMKGINLKILRKLNPWLISNKLTIRPSDFVIKLPSKNENLKSYNSYN
jgi:membrane-bound lytic murein transglycosylase D